MNKLNTIDGETLMSRPLQPLNFVVDTLISQGLHILAGSPKVGKSWLALWLAVAVAKGEPVWGMQVKQGTTLYLCLEDSQLRIQNRLFDVTEVAPANVHFCTESRILGDGLTEQLEQFKQAYPEAYEKNVHIPPMGHLGDAELEIGRVCVQLASPDFKYMTGETLTLEGGLGLRP